MEIENLQNKNQENIQNQLAEQAKLQEQVLTLETLAKKHMSKEAISRYGTLKTAHPDTAIKAIALIAQASQLGQLKETLTDEAFKEILKQIQGEKKEFKIRK